MALVQEVTAGAGETAVTGLLLWESLAGGKTAQGHLDLY